MVKEKIKSMDEIAIEVLKSLTYIEIDYIANINNYTLSITIELIDNTIRALKRRQ